MKLKEFLTRPKSLILYLSLFFLLQLWLKTIRADMIGQLSNAKESWRWIQISSLLRTISTELC